MTMKRCLVIDTERDPDTLFPNKKKNVSIEQEIQKIVSESGIPDEEWKRLARETTEIPRDRVEKLLDAAEDLLMEVEDLNYGEKETLVKRLRRQVNWFRKNAIPYSW